MESVRDIICSDKFIETPVNEVNSIIDAMKDKVVVINGDNGIGKSTILNARNINPKKNTSSILADFRKDSVISFLEPELHEHYLEISMTNALIDHVMKKGKTSQVAYAIDRANSKYMGYLIEYLNDLSLFDELSPFPEDEEPLCVGDYTEALIHDIKKNEGTDSIELLIDNFDIIEESNPNAQKGIQKYFDLFDKVVLVTNDENYESDYAKVEPKYSRSYDDVGQIIRYVISSDFDENTLDWLDIMHNQTIQSLITRSNGNLSIIIDALKETYRYNDVSEFNIGAIKNEMYSNVEKMVNSLERRKTLSKKPKLVINKDK
ncbi:MAG: hypothetical protein IJ565_04880 [Bacilli bacterium]|nr:hypothetical protein [Bacilli bacterium]